MDQKNKGHGDDVPKKDFFELMDWLYVQYVPITPLHLIQNQEEMQATYNIKDPIKILFDQIKMGQDFYIPGNSPFSDHYLADMGVKKILQRRNIHMCISCGRVLRKKIARGCSSSRIFRKPTWTENISSRRLERQAMEVPTTSITVR